jgi:hypothetical protein
VAAFMDAAPTVDVPDFNIDVLTVSAIKVDVFISYALNADVEVVQ